MAVRQRTLGSIASVAVLACLVVARPGAARPVAAPSTPIEHLVVIFQENSSFDHYFGRYPHAKNPAGQPRFVAARDTPKVNGLTKALRTNNPNLANPFRVDRSHALTCDQGHGYTEEQRAFDNGAMDRFVQETGNNGAGCLDNEVMGYFDGNTVTALWNYAQHFAMSDRFFNTTFGPSTPGAIDLVSGQTHGASPDIPGAVVNGTMIGDPDPVFDDCGNGATASLSGQNVGDLLNNAGVTWGWFQGGLRPTSTAPDGTASCDATHENIGGVTVPDYSPHHEPFQYYGSTANPHHLPPSSASMIGQTDQANHQYDLSDFWGAAHAGVLPAVSFLKAARYQDGHPGYSDPLDEQRFLVSTINRLQGLREWSDMAVMIAWDDSDGWYDHVMGPIVSPSADPAHDALTGPGTCGSPAPGAYQDRCGYGPRLPFLLVSRYAKRNFVSHGTADQTSILRFIENNWGLPQIGDQSLDAQAGSLLGMFDFAHPRSASQKFLLSPSTGLPR